MRKWNGWGDESVRFPANPGVQAFLQQALGPTAPLPDASSGKSLPLCLLRACRHMR